MKVINVIDPISGTEYVGLLINEEIISSDLIIVRKRTLYYNKQLHVRTFTCPTIGQGYSINDIVVGNIDPNYEDYIISYKLSNNLQYFNKPDMEMIFKCHIPWENVAKEMVQHYEFLIKSFKEINFQLLPEHYRAFKHDERFLRHLAKDIHYEITEAEFLK